MQQFQSAARRGNVMAPARTNLQKIRAIHAQIDDKPDSLRYADLNKKRGGVLREFSPQKEGIAV
jgi:hypothetical protein